MQAEATQDPTRPVRRVYAAEVARIQRQGGGDRSQIPSFESVKSAIKRTRSQTLPPVPHHVQDVAIDGPWAETWMHERFLQHLDNDWGVAISVQMKTCDNSRSVKLFTWTAQLRSAHLLTIRFSSSWAFSMGS